MAFDPLIEEPKEEAPPAPDPIVAVQAQIAEMQKNLQEQINAAYQANKGIATPAPQVQYVPYPVQQAAEQAQELNEADILADLPGAIQREAERIAAERENKLREELGTHLGRIYEDSYERTMRDLETQPHFPYVAEELKKHFADHPDEKYQPGRIKEKYDSLIGAKYAQIRDAEMKAAEAAQEAREANEPARVRTVDHAVPTSSSPMPPTQPKAEPQLTEAEEAARQGWNRNFGLGMSKEEWTGITKGNLLPMDYDDLPGEELE